MNVLLYQNKPADALKIYLEHFGYRVTLLDYQRISSFASITSSMLFDLIILEELPEISCFRHLDRIGPINKDTPKLLLTKNTADSLLITALELGFNAIWLKPISPRVLFAQMKQIADPLSVRVPLNNYIELFEDIVYNTTKRTIEKNGNIIVSFTETESIIFKALASHINRAIKKEDILRQAGTKMNTAKNSRSFDVFLSYIRSKLKAIPILSITRNSQKELMLYVDPTIY